MFVRIFNKDETDFLDVSPEVVSKLAQEQLVVRCPQNGDVRVAPSSSWLVVCRRAATLVN